MRSLTGLVTALLAVAFTVAGCPPNNGTSNGENGDLTDTGPIEADTTEEDTRGSNLSLAEFDAQFGQLLQEFFCKSRWACPKRAVFPGIGYVTNYPDQESCVQGDSITRTVGQSLITPGLRQDLSDERAEFDAAAAESCLSELQSTIDGPVTNCNVSLRETINDVCNETQIFNGNAALGDPCRSDHSCSGNPRECDRSSGNCEGTCVEPSGGSETSLGEGETCQEDFQCGDGLTCAPESANGDSSTCIQIGARTGGQPCGDTLDCALNHICTSSELCAEVTIRESGQSCDTNAQVCEPGTVCLANNSDDLVCQPPASEGSSCSVVDAACIGTLVCSDGSCSAGKSGGEFCSMDNECYSDECTTDQTCAPSGSSACR